MFIETIFKKQKSPVFIIGAPRSGTTWLWGLLTSFPEVVPLLKEDFNPSEKTIIDGKFRTSETGAFINYSNAKIKSVIKKKQKKYPQKTLLEKTPLHILHINDILHLFPKSKIIYIQRDPRATISSMLNSNFFNFANSLDDAIEKYSNYISAAQPFLNHPNIKIVKYENLLKDTKKELLKILNFLKIKYSIEDLNKAIQENSQNSKVAIKGVFRKGFADGYKDELTEIQLKKIYFRLKNIFDLFDYK